MTASLTLGPLLYNWPPEKKRDFYFRIADEAPVDCVYVGEVVCSKREPFFNPYHDEVIERLEKAGKQVVLSTLALLTLPREVEALRDRVAENRLVEANDVSALQALGGKPFVVGPMINVMNEGTMAAMAAHGAVRVVFASEMSGKAIRTLANYSSSLRASVCERGNPVSATSVAHKTHAPRGHAAAGSPRSAFGSARDDNGGIETEVQVFGRQSLAISMRCYHARAHGRDKDHCRRVCINDPDGLDVDTITGQPLLTVNGTQTLTHGYVVLLDEMRVMAGQGVTHFRLSPHAMDMVKVAQLYRGFLEGRFESELVLNELKSLHKSLSAINGFYHGQEGKRFVVPSLTD